MMMAGLREEEMTGWSWMIWDEPRTCYATGEYIMKREKELYDVYFCSKQAATVCIYTPPVCWCDTTAAHFPVCLTLAPLITVTPDSCCRFPFFIPNFLHVLFDFMQDKRRLMLAAISFGLVSALFYKNKYFQMTPFKYDATTEEFSLNVLRLPEHWGENAKLSITIMIEFWSASDEVGNIIIIIIIFIRQIKSHH